MLFKFMFLMLLLSLNLQVIAQFHWTSLKASGITTMKKKDVTENEEQQFVESFKTS